MNKVMKQRSGRISIFELRLLISKTFVNSSSSIEVSLSLLILFYSLSLDLFLPSIDERGELVDELFIFGNLFTFISSAYFLISSYLL